MTTKGYLKKVSARTELKVTKLDFSSIHAKSLYLVKMGPIFDGSSSKPLFPPSLLSVHVSGVRACVRHTSAFHPINSSRCLNSLIKVAPYDLGVDP